MKGVPTRSLCRGVLLGVLAVLPLWSSRSASGQSAGTAPQQGGAPTKPAEAAKVAGTPAADDQTDCAQFLPVLTGKKQSSALLANARLRATASRSADLVTCGAVAADSD